MKEKNIYRLLLMALMVCLVACNRDDDSLGDGDKKAILLDEVSVSEKIYSLTDEYYLSFFAYIEFTTGVKRAPANHVVISTPDSDYPI